MRQKRRLLIAFAAIVASALPAFAQNSASEVDQLLDLLVAKNVITSTEASEFRATLKKNAPASSNSEVAQASSVQSATGEQPVNGQIATRTLGLKNDGLNVSGFVQGRFTEAPGTTNTFEIRRARLIFDGKVTDGIGYQVQLDGVKSQLLDAKIDFNPVHQFRVTIGQFKIPFSTESYTSDNLLPFVERSTVVNSFAPGRDNGNNGRDIGLQVSGKFLRLRGTDRVEYFAGVFNGAGINTKDDNHYKDTAARLVLRPLKQVALVGNYYSGATGLKELGRERADLEVNFTQGPISASAEYIWGHDGPIHRHGWYAQSGYRASRHWEALFRFDKFDPRQHTATLTAVNNYVIGTNYFLNSYVKLQANYDRQQDLIARRSANVVLLQTQFQFGGERVKQ
jgi:phosphate-selective porin OprO and OprP